MTAFPSYVLTSEGASAARGIPSTTQTGATYTFALTDKATRVRGNRATSQIFTVPPHSSVAFTAGDWLEIEQKGAGQITIAEGAGVTIRKPATLSLALAEQWATAFLYYAGSDEWVLSGYLAAP